MRIRYIDGAEPGAAHLVGYVFGNLADADRAELEIDTGVPAFAVGQKFHFALGQRDRDLPAPVIFVAGTDDGEPCCLMSIYWQTPRSGAINLFVTTRAFHRIAPAFAVWTRRKLIPGLVGQGMLRCECRTIATHDRALRFIAATGGILEAWLDGYGLNGETFVQLAWHAHHGPQETASSHHDPASRASPAPTHRAGTERRAGRRGGTAQAAQPEGSGSEHPHRPIDPRRSPYNGQSPIR